jgi:peptidoglycan hydrolase-like protein with peptidoglycan-binding domain
MPAALAAAAAAGAVVTVAVRGGAPAPAAVTPPRLATATVVRASLATRVLTGGTLGYAPARPLVNQLAGTYTWLPRPGRAIRPGQVLYRVDNAPVMLMAGVVPAWRPFTPGMTDGPDVRQLQAGLIAGGFADGLLSAPTGHYDQLTVDAVLRWQSAHGYTQTGTVPLGTIQFEPAPVLVTGLTAAIGAAASAGQSPLRISTGLRVVRVPLNPNLPQVRVREPVRIILPSGERTPGRVTAVGPGHGSAAHQLTVRPLRPRATGTGSGVQVQVALTVQSVHGVLAVPVTALLALAGGGYGVDVVTRPGRDRLVGVTTGIFAGGRVQISGPGITPGTRVEVAQ